MNNGGWSAERRAKQSEAIRRWAPWTKTTGPTTPRGKEICANNGRKHELWSPEIRAEVEAIKRLLKKVEE